MSTLRQLTTELAARTDPALLRLFALRPELMEPPVADFAALAARASSRAGLARALDRLNQPQLQVLTALFVTAPDAGATAAELAAAVAGTMAADLAPLLDQLSELALVVPAPNDAGPCRFLPVASLRDVLGAHPAGLGRSYGELADSLPGCRDRLAGIAAAHRSAVAGDPAAVLHQAVTSCPDPGLLLADAPAGTAELLAKFRHGPMGLVGHALRGVAAGTKPPTGESSSRDIIDWLLARGLLIPLDDDHVELPAEVGLLLRRGHVITDFAPAPPVLSLDGMRTSRRDNAALGAIAAVLRTMTRLLDSVEYRPLDTLRTGGVGVRAVRTVARDLDVDVAQSYFYLELAAAAGLISLDPDTSRWRAAAAGWRARDRAEQWLWLAAAWLDADRLPSLIGTGSPAVNVLAGEAFRPDAPQLRESSLRVLATLYRGPARALPPGTVPAPTLPQLMAHFAWHHPRPARRIAKALAGFLAEAEILGLTGAGALTDIGLAVIDRDWDTALARVAEALPAPVEHVLLQGDLTAVAPGFLSPAVAAELALLADAEGKGTAGVYRFSAASIQRALAAGRTAEGILAFLAAHSATPVPQPLDYLLKEAASRHGRLTVGTAGTYVSSDDAALLAELLAGDVAAALEFTAVSPTVVVTPLAPAEVVAALRAAGLSPALAGGTSAEREAPHRRSTRAGGTALALNQAVAPYEAARLLAGEEATAGDDAVVPGSAAAAQLGLLRSRPAFTPGRGESAPALVLEQLRAAIRHQQVVWVTTVSADGRPERLRLHPVSVAEGRLRAFEPARERERVVSIHRVMDVEPVEPQTKGTP
ncbi:helicase-associated domain-containing protein [Specibacter sp. RAF43]|uniref:helicase-associated domain-containing protein n=1 Tax=Specibacter sp. RAF43 TaxID=3233057 RepID=UPI003F97887C